MPLFDGVAAIAAANRSGGMGSNREYFGPSVKAAGLDPTLEAILFDPQTSGGLLIAAAPAAAAALEARLAAAGVAASRIGSVLAEVPGSRVIVV